MVKPIPLSEEIAAPNDPPWCISADDIIPRIELSLAFSLFRPCGFSLVFGITLGSPRAEPGTTASGMIPRTHKKSRGGGDHPVPCSFTIPRRRQISLSSRRLSTRALSNESKLCKKSRQARRKSRSGSSGLPPLCGNVPKETNKLHPAISHCMAESTRRRWKTDRPLPNRPCHNSEIV